MKDTGIIEQAVKVAATAHAGQLRKDGTPYISHPFTVGLILWQYGFDAEVVAAGILHDVIEDTSITKEEIEQIFGPAVTETVTAVSENPNLIWVERKVDLVQQIGGASVNAKAVAAADHISNLRDFFI